MQVIMQQKQAILDHIKQVDTAIENCRSMTSDQDHVVLDLSNMSLTNDRLTTLVLQLHQECPAITELRLARNFLQSFPAGDLLKGFPHLRLIELTDNPIKHVQWAAIAEHPSLEAIDLQYCSLDELSIDMDKLRPSFAMYLFSHANKPLMTPNMIEVHKCHVVDTEANLSAIQKWCAVLRSARTVTLTRGAADKWGLKLRSENGRVTIVQLHEQGIAIQSVREGELVSVPQARRVALV